MRARPSYSSSGIMLLIALGVAGRAQAATDIAIPATVSADVAPACTLSIGQNLNFGTASSSVSMSSTAPGASSSTSISQIDAQGFVFVQCSYLASYNIYAPYSSNASGAQRRLQNGSSGNYINYAISAVSATGASVPATQASANASPYSRQGAGYQEAITIYGRVPAQTLAGNPTRGAYTDIINFTVAY